MTDKDKYRLLCTTERSIPLFSRDWWLDIVCGEDKWDVFWLEQKGHVQAALPFYIPYKGVISMPAFTQTMGPWFAPVSGDTKYTTQLGVRQALCKEFIDKLKPYTSFLQNFNYEITDWLPFYWTGYKQTTRYTYILPDLSQTEQLWEDMSLHTRRNITKAKEKQAITIRSGISVEEFLRIYARTFERQGKRIPPHSLILEQLINRSRERMQGDIWGGYDTEGNLHAAVFIVWQESSAYYIAGGGDSDYRSSGAHSLAMWEAIQYVSSKSERFDFEGSMLPGVERFFREFGAVQTPYFAITKGDAGLLHKMWWKFKQML